MRSKSKRGWFYGLDVKCAPKAHVLETQAPADGTNWEVGSRWRKEITGAFLWRIYWDPESVLSLCHCFVSWRWVICIMIFDPTTRLNYHGLKLLKPWAKTNISSLSCLSQVFYHRDRKLRNRWQQRCKQNTKAAVLLWAFAELWEFELQFPQLSKNWRWRTSPSTLQGRESKM